MSENQSLLNDKLNQLLKDEKLDKDFSEAKRYFYLRVFLCGDSIKNM